MSCKACNGTAGNNFQKKPFLLFNFKNLHVCFCSQVWYCLSKHYDLWIKIDKIVVWNNFLRGLPLPVPVSDTKIVIYPPLKKSSVSIRS